MRVNYAGPLINVIAKSIFESSDRHANDLSCCVGTMDVYIDDLALVVELNVPGFRDDQIQVQLNNGRSLLISGTIAERDEKPVYLRRERTEGAFERQVALPFPVDAEKVEARVESGVLTVRLPQLASSLPRRIPVNQHLAS